jgi:probable HAF family extracellular repeat protein
MQAIASKRLRRAVLGAAAMLACFAAVAVPPLYRIEVLAKDHGVRPESAQAINRHGVIAGYGWMGSRDSSVVYVGRNGDLRPLDGPQVNYAFGNAINADGAVAGTALAQAWMWDANGVPTALDPLVPCDHAGLQSSGTGINDAGVVVLQAECRNSDGGTTRSFRYSGGVMQDLGHLGTDYNSAQGINKLGQVVGTSVTPPDGNGQTHARAYRLEGNVMHDLGTLGGRGSVGHAINDLGHVVGTSEDSSGVSRAFLHDGSSMQALPACANSETYPTPLAINRLDEIVGDHIHRRHVQGILFRRGKCYPLLSLLDTSGVGWDRLHPSGINDDGVIVGWGLLDGKVRAFVATPVAP